MGFRSFFPCRYVEQDNSYPNEIERMRIAERVRGGKPGVVDWEGAWAAGEMSCRTLKEAPDLRQEA